MKNILLYLLLASNFLFAEENTNEISAKLEDFFPDKKIAVKKLDPNGLRSLINAHLEASPYLKQLESNIQSSDEQSNAMEAFLSPKLNFNLGINGYDSYFREVYVYENIPVAYDDQNPIISNINLPNGGEGIIWLPRPTEYALRDIPLTASEKYYSYVANSSAGLYYKFPFGLQINAFNVSLKYRGLPKNYGYPWSADISTSFNLPIFKSFGYYGQPENISIENQKISNDILLKSKISSKNSVVFGIITNYFSLLNEYDKIHVIDSLIALNNIQRMDIDLLASKNRVTVSDVINVKSVTNRYKVQKQDALNQAAYYSGMLNPDPFVDSEVILYEAASIDYAGLIEKMKSKVNEIRKDSLIVELIDSHPQTEISELNVKMSEMNLKYAENQNKFDLDFTGSVSAIHTDYLGFKSAGTALGKIVTHPDAFVWNFGLQYTLPTKDYDEHRLLSSQHDLESSKFEMKNTKKYLEESVEKYLYKLRSAEDMIKNSEDALQDAYDLYKKDAELLYEKNRIDRYTHSAYLIQIQTAYTDLLSARTNYILTFFAFANDLNLDVTHIINNLN